MPSSLPRRAALLGLCSILALAGCGDPTGTTDAGPAGDAPGPDAGLDTGIALPPPYDWTEDWRALAEGVSVLDLGGALASPVVAWDEGAFPVAVDGEDATFVSAARVGDGFALAYGHESLIYGVPATDDRVALLENALQWMAGGRSPLRVGVEGSHPELVAVLEGTGATVVPAGVAELGAVDVWITTHYEPRSEADEEAVRAFVRGGGGLISGGHGWYWASTHEGQSIGRDFEGNQLVLDLGLVITSEGTTTGRVVLPGGVPGPLLHAGRALELLAAHVDGSAPLTLAEQLRGVRTVGRAASAIPLDATYWLRLRALRPSLGEVTPSEEAPLEVAMRPITMLAARIDDRLARELAADEVTAHPAAVGFPGLVPEGTPTVARTVTIDASYPVGRDARFGYSGARAAVWRSTGLYVPAGSPLRITVPARASTAGLAVRIGCHSDELWEAERWTRFPAVDRVDAITSTETRTASAFGGLVYVAVPVGADLGAVEVQIEGAVPAPVFVAGQTSPDAWRSEVRSAAAPFGELVGRTLAISAPAASLRALDDPDAVLAFWDEVLDLDADLAAIPRARVRPERIAFDRQIGAGYMHSGYPIMAPVTAVADALDIATVRAAGSWGLFHELGHNHQWTDWVLPETTESSVNLWSVRVSEDLLGLSRDVAHPALAPAERAARIDEFIAGGRRFASWDAWGGLEWHLQLQSGFGWAFYERLFAEYQALPEGEAPADEAERIEQWISRTCGQAGRDLEPFYRAWGFPVTPAASAACGAFPVWAENPMR
jgi:hypothetical protein